MRLIPKFLPVFFLSLGSLSCAGLQLSDVFDTQAPLTESTVIDGLKEALRIGTERTSSSLSARGGFSDNLLLRIVYPDELASVTRTLRRIGLDSQVDEFETNMNRAAEQAAGEAIDVFVSAIGRMSVQDAFGILDGADDAATTYFQERTSEELRIRFAPVVNGVMEDVGVYQAYTSIIDAYNTIPLTTPVSFDLEEHILDGTLSGLFSVLADEELRIREDPLARTTALLKRVFGPKS